MPFVVGLLEVGLTANTTSFDLALRKAKSRGGQAARSIAADFRKQGSMFQALGRDLTTYFTVPVAAVGFASARAALQFEQSFARVEKTIGGSAAELEQLQRQIRDIAAGPKAIPVSAFKLNEIAEITGQLGVARENVLDFTKTIAEFSAVTKIAGQESATQMARFANNTQLPITEVRRLASTVLALGDSSAATEEEILALGLRLSGAGKIVGLVDAEILAIAASLASVGIEAEAGGTAFSRVFREIQIAVEKGGTKLDDFAHVAEMSAADFAETFQQKPAQAIKAFIEGFVTMQQRGESLFGALEDLGLENVRISDAILRSANAGRLLSDAFDTASKAFRENTALTEKSKIIFATQAAQLEINKNKLTEVAIKIGQEVLPAVVALSGGVVALAGAFAQLPGPVQTTILGMAGLAAAAGPLLLVYGGLATTLGRVAGMFGKTTHTMGGILLAGGGAVDLFGRLGGKAAGAADRVLGVGRSLEVATRASLLQRIGTVGTSLRAIQTTEAVASLSAMEARLLAIGATSGPIAKVGTSIRAIGLASVASAPGLATLVAGVGLLAGYKLGQLLDGLTGITDKISEFQAVDNPNESLIQQLVGDPRLMKEMEGRLYRLRESIGGDWEGRFALPDDPPENREDREKRARLTVQYIQMIQDQRRATMSATLAEQERARVEAAAAAERANSAPRAVRQTEDERKAVESLIDSLQRETEILQLQQIIRGKLTDERRPQFEAAEQIKDPEQRERERARLAQQLETDVVEEAAAAHERLTLERNHGTAAQKKALEAYQDTNAATRASIAGTEAETEARKANRADLEQTIQALEDERNALLDVTGARAELSAAKTPGQLQEVLDRLSALQREQQIVQEMRDKGFSDDDIDRAAALLNEAEARRELLEIEQQAADVKSSLLTLTQQQDIAEADLGKLYEAGALSAAEYGKALYLLRAAFKDLREQEIQAGVNLTEFGKKALLAAQSAQQSFEDALFSRFEDGVDGMVRQFLEGLARMASAAAAQALFTPVVNWINGAFGNAFLGAVAGTVGGTGGVPATGGGANVGMLPSFARGGEIDGPGTTTSDSIPAADEEGKPRYRLSKREWIVNAAAARKVGPRFMKSLNAGLIEPVRMATGGMVGRLSESLAMPGFGRELALPGAAPGGDTFGGPQFNVTIDARGAGPGVGQEIRRALAEFKSQVVGEAVQTVAARRLRGGRYARSFD